MCGFWLLVFCLCVLLVSCFQGNLISILLKIPVVDRPCLALARQCRKKKLLDLKKLHESFHDSSLAAALRAAVSCALRCFSSCSFFFPEGTILLRSKIFFLCSQDSLPSVINSGKLGKTLFVTSGSLSFSSSPETVEWHSHFSGDLRLPLSS